MSSREQFEAWWEVNYHNGQPPRHGWEFWRDGEGYSIEGDEEFQWRWEAWQAATSAIEAKCAALAAENAGLKDINEWCKTDAFKNMHREFKTAESIGCPDVDCMHDAMLVAIMHAPETPVTDAYFKERGDKC